MSTREIRKVLDAVSEEFGEGHVRAAMAEVEAIENAAKAMNAAMTGDPGVWDDFRAARDLMAAIARQGGGQ